MANDQLPFELFNQNSIVKQQIVMAGQLKRAISDFGLGVCWWAVELLRLTRQATVRRNG